MDSAKRLLLSRAVAAALLLAPAAATAQAIVTDVLDAADGDDPFDAAIEVRYQFHSHKADLTREFPCYRTDGNAACTAKDLVLFGNELTASRTIHTMTISPRIGLYHDLELALDLPIILFDQTKLDFATGVSDATNSSVDKAGDAAGSLFLVPNVGQQRSGFGDMDISLKYAPYNYQRDHTEPTWVLGLTYTAPTGKVRKTTNTDVGQGIHALRIFTTISRRALPWIEPYFDFHGVFRFPASDTLFKDGGPTQTLVSPGNSMGLMLGTEFLPWEDNDKDARVEIDIGMLADYFFEGREYTDLFEALGGSQCNANPACLLTAHTLDVKGKQASPSRTDGITDVEHYANFGTWIGVHYQPVKYIQFGATFAVNWQTDHLLTNADPGKDLDGDGQVLETGARGNEFNPVYVQSLDAPAGDRELSGSASRFRQENTTDIMFQFHLTGKF